MRKLQYSGLFCSAVILRDEIRTETQRVKVDLWRRLVPVMFGQVAVVAVL